MSEGLRNALATQIAEHGFSDFGICAPASMQSAGDTLHDWVAEGYHGEMGWMAERINWRADAAALWPEARSVIMLTDSYAPAENPLPALEHRDQGVISVYAKNRDYHDHLKKRLKRIARWLVAETDAEVKVFVDTAPVMEKPLAQAAGLGWQGKHTNLVSRNDGSWVFLGAIFTTADLPLDVPHGDRCGSCRACIDVCPTAAFPAPYRLDARRCISYLTIELKGSIPREFRAAMGNRIYGCDDCLAVCPWNKFAVESAHAAYHPREELRAPLLAKLAVLDDAAFRALFTASPIKRIGRDRFLRNVLIAIGNSGSETLIPIVQARLVDASPLVRGAAIWALSRLCDNATWRAARAASTETDTMVLEEWQQGEAERADCS